MAEVTKKACEGCGYYDGHGCTRSPIGEIREICPCDIKPCLISKSRIMMYLADLMLAYSPGWGSGTQDDDERYDFARDMAYEITNWEDDSGAASMDGYQALAARTINRNLSKPEIERHGLYGLGAEAGEVQAIFQKELQGHDVRKDDLMKELGDVLWMVAEICTVCGLSMADVAQLNISKLMDRYPDGFDPERSLHRKAES